MLNERETHPGDAPSGQRNDIGLPFHLKEKLNVPEGALNTPHAQAALIERLVGSLGEGDISEVEAMLNLPSFSHDVLRDPGIIASTRESFKRVLHRNVNSALRLDALIPLPKEDKDRILFDAVMDTMRIGHTYLALEILKAFEVPKKVFANEEIKRLALIEYKAWFHRDPAAALDIKQAFRLPEDMALG